MARFILSAELRVRANTQSIRRARAQIKAGLQGIVGSVGVAGGGVGGRGAGVGGAGVVGGRSADFFRESSSAHSVFNRNLKRQAAAARAAARAQSKEVRAASRAQEKAARAQDKLAKSMRLGTKANMGFGQSLRSQTRILSTSIRDIATLTGGVLTLHLAFTALTRGIGGAVQFQAQLAGMAQITGDTVKNMSVLGDTITDLSLKFGVSANILGQNAQELLQAGRSITEVKQALPTLALLGTNAQVGAEGLQNASKAMIVWGNVFGMTMEQTRQAFEKAVKLSKAQFVNVADLINSTTVLASLNEGLNISFEETISLVAALKSQTGRPVGEVSRGLRTLETRVTRRPKTIEFLEKRGVKIFDDVTGDVRNIVRILSDIKALEDRLGGASREGQQLQQILTGIRQSQFGAALLKSLPQLKANLELIGGEINEMERDFTIWSETTQHAANQVAASFRNMFREITTESESFNVLAGSVLFATKSMADLIATMKDILPLLVGVGGIALARAFGGRLIGGSASFAASRNLVEARRTGGSFGGFVGRSTHTATGRSVMTPFGVSRDTRARGRFTPGRGLSRLGARASFAAQKAAPALGFGAIAAGSALSRRDDSLSKGAGAGLSSAGLLSLLGIGPLGAAVAGVAFGIQGYTNAVDDQARQLTESSLLNAANELGAALQDLGNDITVSALREQLPSLQLSTAKFEKDLKESSKDIGTTWQKISDMFTFFSIHLRPIGPPTGRELQRQLREDPFGTSRPPPVIGKVGLARRKFTRESIIDRAQTSDIQLLPVFEKLIKQGIPRRALLGLADAYEDSLGIDDVAKLTKVREKINDLSLTEVQIREKINDALRSSLAVTSTTLSDAIRDLRVKIRPIKDVGSPKSFLLNRSGLDFAIYSDQFKEAFEASGIRGIKPQVGTTVDEIRRGLDIVGGMFKNIDALNLRSGRTIAQQFISQAGAKGVNLDNTITTVIAEGLEKLDWQKISDLLDVGGINAVKDFLLESFTRTTKYLNDFGEALSAVEAQDITQLQEVLSRDRQVRQSRIGINQTQLGIFGQQRQFAGLPTLPGLGAQVLEGGVSATIPQLKAELEGLRASLETAGIGFEKAQISEAIKNTADQLRMLADVTARTGDIMQRLGEVEQSRSAKLGIVEEFFGGDVEHRQRIRQETRAAQMAVRQGSLLTLPSVEAQQMAVSGLRRFSGVENFLGTGQTGGQVLEDLLERAGGGFVLPENVEIQNLQKQVLQQQLIALAAEMALADEEKTRAQEFFNQLGEAHTKFLNELRTIFDVVKSPFEVSPFVPSPFVPSPFVPSPFVPSPFVPSPLVQDMNTPRNIAVPPGGNILQQRLGVRGGPLPHFLGGEPRRSIGETFFRGQRVIPLEEQKNRRRAAKDAEKLERQALREEDLLKRRFGDAPGPGAMLGIDRKRQEARELRRRAAGIPDIEKKPREDQEARKQFREDIGNFGKFVDNLLIGIQKMFGGAPGIPVGVPDMPRGGPPAQHEEVFRRLNEGASSFNDGAQQLSTSLSTGSESLTNFGLQFDSSTSRFSDSITQFMESVPTIGSSIENAITNIASTLSDALPDAIDLNTRQNINVTIDGNEALGVLSDQMIEIATNAAKSEFRKLAASLDEFGTTMTLPS